MSQALESRISVNAIGPRSTLLSSRQDDASCAAQLDELILRYRSELGEFDATIRYLWHAKSVTDQMIAFDGSLYITCQMPDMTGMVK